jgi:hypothetical protein
MVHSLSGFFQLWRNVADPWEQRGSHKQSEGNIHECPDELETGTIRGVGILSVAGKRGFVQVLACSASV